MPGYSKTPLVSKLGYKPGMRALVKNPPTGYFEQLGPLPPGVSWLKKVSREMDFVHTFTDSRRELHKQLINYRNQIKPTGVVWVSWPKKSAGIKTDITEDAIRELALPMGFVDIKVCAVDDVWSGLKLVIRKELRTG